MVIENEQFYLPVWKKILWTSSTVDFDWRQNKTKHPTVQKMDDYFSSEVTIIIINCISYETCKFILDGLNTVNGHIININSIKLIYMSKQPAISMLKKEVVTLNCVYEASSYYLFQYKQTPSG